MEIVRKFQPEMFKGIIKELKKEDIEAVEGILDLYWSGELRERFSKRLKDFIDHAPESMEQKYKYFVAEENGEVVGVAALRAAPVHMLQYTKTENPAEFYVLAVKYKRKGIGSALRLKRIEEARKLGFKEVVLYSDESHKGAWDFHDSSDFKRAGPAVAPNGDAGQIWRRII